MSEGAQKLEVSNVRRFRPYPAYKPSGVELLGNVPDHWEVKRLKFAARTIMGQSPSSELYTEDPSERPFLQGNAEFTARFPRAKWFCDAAPKTVPVKALLLSVRAPVGALNEADQPYGIGRGLCAVIDDGAGMDKDFGWYALHLCKAELDTKATGSTYEAVSADDVGNILLALPPGTEQSAIVGFLDSETGGIDTLIAKKRALIEKLKEKRSALISRTVTRGLPPDAARTAGFDPHPPLKPSGVEWLGEIPEHWGTRRLRHISNGITVGVVVNPSSYVSDEGVPFLLGGDIREFSIDTVNCNRCAPATSNGLLRKSRLSPGDLVVVRVGYPGVAAVIPPELDGANCASMMLVRKHPRFSSQWLAYVFNSQAGRDQIDIVQYGAAQKQFNISHAVDFWFPFPPLKEQEMIASFLDRERARFDKLVTKVEAAITRLQEYRTALITAAVTGKIDVRGAVA